MAPTPRLIVAILLLSCFAFCPGRAHDWDVIVPYGDSVSLNCSDPTLKPFNNLTLLTEDEIAWLLPGEVTPNTSRQFSSPYFLEEGGRVLRVEAITKEMSGVYHCAVNINGTWFFIKRGINFGGEAFTSLLDEYKPNLIRAGIAAGSYLVIWIIISLVYKFRYKVKKISPTEDYGYSNRAMSVDADAVTSL